MTPEALAALHAAVFSGVPRPWRSDEFAQLLAQPTILLVTRPHGLLLGRMAGPEAEVLTLGVHPSTRRRGVGAALVMSFEAEAARRGAEEVFLEVAADNLAARALYARLGFEHAGVRPNYYCSAAARPVDALVLCKRTTSSIARVQTKTD